MPKKFKKVCDNCYHEYVNDEIFNNTGNVNACNYCQQDFKTPTGWTAMTKREINLLSPEDREQYDKSLSVRDV